MRNRVTVTTSDSERVTIYSRKSDFDWPYYTTDMHNMVTNVGQFHRDDGPAIVEEDISNPDNPKTLFTCWMNNGKEHRVGGPSSISTRKNFYCEKWCQDGILKRSFAPALIEVTKEKISYSHFHNGKLHRKGAPATLNLDSFKDRINLSLEFYINGDKHNGAGPSEYCVTYDKKRGTIDTSIIWYKHGVTNKRISQNINRKVLPLPVHITKKYYADSRGAIYCFFFDTEDNGPLPTNVIVSFFADGSMDISYPELTYSKISNEDIHRYIADYIPEKLQQKYLYNLSNIKEDYYSVFGIEHLIEDFNKSESYMQLFLGEIFDNKDFYSCYT